MPQFVTDLTNTIFALWRQFHWLPEWAVISIITVVFVFIGWAANQVVFALLKLAVRNRDEFWKGMLKRARLKVRIAVMIIALALAVTVSPLDPEPSLFIRRSLLFGFILVCGWMLAGAVDMGAIVHLKKFNMEAEDNLYARKHVTQTRILQRVAAILIGLITLGLALLTIPGVKQWGLSLLASAGVVGIAPTVTGPRTWLMRVVVRRSTGFSMRLDRSKASRAMSLHSWAVAGSKQGRPPRRA